MIKLARIHEWIIYLLSATLFLSGLAWLYFYYFIRIEGEFGLQIHPLQHTFLVIHGTSGLLFLIAVGSVLPMHVIRAWRLKRNRISGGIYLSLISLLTLTGIGLYYLGGEFTRNLASLIHWVIGLVFPVALGVHIYFGRSRAGRK